MDLSRLNDDELGLLEQLLKKAAGELAGDVVPPFRVEFVRPGRALSQALPNRPLMQTTLSDEFI